MNHGASRRLPDEPLTRRHVLGGVLGAAALGLSACAAPYRTPAPKATTFGPPTPVSPSPGQKVVTARLTAAPVTADLGGLTVRTWAYNGVVPGPLLRASAGDLLRVDLTNELPDETTIHWHGIHIRNAADGLPGITQDAVVPRGSYRYEFTVPQPGTYFFHPHVGTQLDRGLYAPLIVDDPAEPGAYDDEWVVVLDDWIDGTGTDPDAVYAKLVADGKAAASSGSGMGGMMEHGMGGSLYGGGDVTYPHYLVNGRVPSAPQTHTAKPGQRIRIRIVNAASDTVFAVALGGHTLTVTHTDGYAVQPKETSALYIGMGERYDVTVTAGHGAFPLLAQPVGKSGVAMAVLRTGSGAAPRATASLPELGGTPLTASDLAPAQETRLASRSVDKELRAIMSGSMAPYVWGFNGKVYSESEPLQVSHGQRVQIYLGNRSMMTHPFHLHGHTFALPSGVRKDTVLVPPMGGFAVQFDADNAGRWMAHCHNTYHMMAGMMLGLDYS